MYGFMPRYRLRALKTCLPLVPCCPVVPCPVSYPQCQYPRYEVPKVPKVPKVLETQELPYVHGLG